MNKQEIINTIKELKDKRIKWVQTVVPIVSKSLIGTKGVNEWIEELEFKLKQIIN